MATSCTSSSTCSMPGQGIVAPTARNDDAVSADTPIVGEGQRLVAEPLDAFLDRERSFAVAFSGGCDSAYLLAAARRAGCDVAAYLVKTEFQPDFELRDAEQAAGLLDVPLRVVKADVLARADICANPPDRCRLCKRFIFDVVRSAALADGYDVVADGTNATDDPSRRPGFASLAEAGVVSPLRRAGLTKADVRRGLAAEERARGLCEGALLSNKPSFPCLAVYVPEGAPLSRESLRLAAQARGSAS